jgi:hypothetical protein
LKILSFPLFACVFFSFYFCSTIVSGQEHEPTGITISTQIVSQYIGQNGGVFGSGPVQHIELVFTGRSVFTSISGSTGFHARLEQDKEISIGTGFRKNLRTLLITGETRYSLATVGSILSAGITFSGKHRLNKSISFVPFVKLDCFSPIISHGPTPGVLTTLGFDSRIKLPRNFFVSSRLGITKDSGALNFRPGLLLVGTTSLGRLFGHSRSACVLFTFSIPVAGPDRSHIPANGIHDEERHPSISVGIRFSYHYKK